VGALPPLSDAAAEVFGGVDGPQEGGADTFDDDRMGSWLGVEVGSDAAVGLAGVQGGEGVCTEAVDPVRDSRAVA